MPSLPYFRGFAGLLIVGVVAHVATLVPRVMELAGEIEGGVGWVVVGFVVTGATALAAAALAGLLLVRASHRPGGRALTLFLAFLGLFWGSVFRFLNVSVTEGEVALNLSYTSGWLDQTALVSFLLAGAAFVRFSTLFPQPLEADRLPPPRLSVPPFRWMRRLRVAFLNPAVIWGSAIATYLVQRSLPDIAAILFGARAAGGLTSAVLLAFLLSILLMVAYALSCMGLGARNLRDGYRLAGPEERGRVLWLVAGFSMAWWLILAAAGSVAVGAIVDSAEGSLSTGIALLVALVLAPLVAVVGAAVGVLYSGAIDPALALERSTIYGALGAIGVMGFAALESVISELLEAWVPLPGIVGPVVAGVLVAAALLPLRAVLRRVFPGRWRPVAEGGAGAPGASDRGGRGGRGGTAPNDDGPGV